MDKLGRLIGLLIKRWTSDSPKTYKYITNTASVVSVLGGVSLMLPVTYPFWALAGITVLTGASTVLATGSKLTTNDKEIIKETKEVKGEIAAEFRNFKRNTRKGKG